jgi:glycosyltransferase involved in cell wall biosynthesis
MDSEYEAADMTSEKQRLRILHLAYEDPRQPGSGGGSVRTWEINRRLADRHDISVIVAGYPGAVARIEDGVRWIPLGPRTGGKIDRIAYFAQVGPALRRWSHDLVVEEFSAPFSTAFSPIFTQAPVVASVQWLFAREMRRKYHLPFDWVERLGLRCYHDFITVSSWLAREVCRQKPKAVIEPIPNGIDDVAFTIEPLRPEHLLFVGRLDQAQKGADLLLDIYARFCQRFDGSPPPLLVVGDGPDRCALAARAERLGIAERVEFLGRVEGAEKYRLMAAAYAVLMPSRFETFGMVAAESLAVGVPLVTFDIGPLQEVVGRGGAFLVPPFDLECFTSIVLKLAADRDVHGQGREMGRAWAQRYRWDEIAMLQEQHYWRAVERANEHKIPHAKQ